MEITGEYRIPASKQTVWDALNDPEVLKECLPGCEEIEKTSNTEMKAKITTKVGPVKAKFTGAVTLSDLDPPNGYTLTGEGQGGAAGFASGVAKVKLTEDGDHTVLTYEVDAKVGGKLAQIGSRLIDSTAKKLSAQFFGALAEKLGGGAEEKAAAAPAPAAEAAPAGSSSEAPGPSGASQAPAKRGLPTVAWVAAIVVVAVVLIVIFAT